MKIKAVIFDLDGTITEPFLDFDLIRRKMGLAQNVGSVLEIMAKAPEKHRKQMERILNYYESRAVQESVLNAGAYETLRKLRQMGIHTEILTRNSRSNALAVAEKHNLLFDAVLGREDGPVKPDGYGVLKICGLFGASPKETIVVGDYLHDLLSAKAAGAWAVLLKTHQKCEEFVKYADFTITSLDRLFEIIDNEANA